MIDILSNSVLQNVRTTLSRTTLFFYFIHPVFIQDQPASATCQAILSSVILAQYEGKKFHNNIIIIIMAGMAVFNVAGYLIEERRRWPVITASPRGQCSK